MPIAKVTKCKNPVSMTDAKTTVRALVLALALAAMMIVSMMPSFAATKDRTISISGLEDGDKVNFYQVLAWAADSTTAAANGAVSGWYFVAPFNNVFDSNGDKGAGKLRAAVNAQNQLELTDTLAGDIARAINGQSVTPVNGNTPVAESSGTATYTFTGVDENDTTKDGLYMAIVTPAKQDFVYNPVFVHLDSSTDDDDWEVIKDSASYWGNSGAAKKSDITLTKTATNSSDYNGDNGDTTKPGDVLDMTVTTEIPGYGEMFKWPVFKLTDTMNHLKLKHGNNEIHVSVGGTDITGDTTKYSLDATDNGYTITFTEAYLKTFQVSAGVEVTYKAEVLEGANTNVVKEKNTVELEYSHDPTTESDSNHGGDKEYKKDITNHYTFSIDAHNLIGPSEDRIGDSGSEIVKIGVDKDGKPITEKTTWSKVTTTEKQAGSLAGAEFELLDGNKNSFSPKKTATSDEFGRINFTGLDAGTYYLKETKAPAGYVTNTDILPVVIAATLTEKTITEYYDQDGNWYAEQNAGNTLKAFTYKTFELSSYTVTYGNQASTYTFDHVFESKDVITKWNIQSSAEAPQSITNTKGVELPSTGGIGTTIFYVGGSLMVLAAAILLITKRRMGVED